MGLLDDAIREHLDLKRRRGADPTEIERAEREALGPVRRGPEVGGEGESAVELAAAEPESAVPSPAAEDWEPFDAEAEFQEPAPALEDEALLPAYEPDEEFEDESFEASPFDAEAESAPPPHPADLSPEPEPEPSLAPHPADHRRRQPRLTSIRRPRSTSSSLKKKRATTTCSRAPRSSSRTPRTTTASGSSSARRETSTSTAESLDSPQNRGHSSVGRAPALQAGGHGFESRWLHWRSALLTSAFRRSS